MPTQCTATTRHGPCRAWALRDSNPPLCSAHAGRNAGAGPPAGNQNRRTAGFYSRHLQDLELADLVALAGNPTLDDEIALARVVVRRVMAALGGTGDDHALDPEMAAHIFAGVRTVARLLQARRLISGGAADSFADAMTVILTELGEELGGRFVE